VVTPLRILFFGTPEFAVPALQALLAAPDTTVVGAVTQPDRPRGRGQHVSASPVKARAEAAGLPVLQPTKLGAPDFLDAMRELAPDLGVVAAYGRLLPESVLALPRLGLVNVHASLLPRWRGASPIERAIMAGDAVTGVTIMRVVKALDAGAMFSAAETPIDPDETAAALETRLAAIGAELLAATLPSIARGTAVETPQDEALVTLAPLITKADGLLDWDLSARAIHDTVRALVPWPRAYTFAETTRHVIHDTRAHASVAAAWMALGAGDRAPAGVVAHAGVVAPSPKGTLLVGAGEGTVVEIRRLQEDGRKALEARAFLAGRALPPGTAFSAGASS
jgi:methionyl-tRNA formyltransferase